MSSSAVSAETAATDSVRANTRAAVVLTSGGLDSATCLAIAKADGFARLHALTFDYGQRHRHELAAAERVAYDFGAEHKIVTLNLRQFGGSALTSDDIAVPKDRDEAAMADGVPVTYVPARNTVFLSYALAWAEVLDVRDVYVGVNAVDYSGYPDCRPAFIAAFEALANVATAMTTDADSPQRFRVHAPLIQMTKAEIISRGVALHVDYGLTHSCYDPDADGLACGHCDSCVIRRRGFAEAHVPDPTRYADAA